MAAKPKTLVDFRAAHDKNVIIPSKIRAALAAMLKEGPENFEYEADFLRRAGVSNTDIGMFRSQFEKGHIVEVGGRKMKRVWFADPKVARKARGE